jgi:DMSO/TMAO reductase YedYZ heme-binding membrane subunit/nitrite reductase/ring-hydroxylating ferredoxin subunit
MLCLAVDPARCLDGASERPARSTGSSPRSAGGANPMSVAYKTVTWNRNKILYDAVLVAAVTIYLFIFFMIAPLLQPVTRPYDDSTLAMDAYGSCAFLMLTVILCVGPLARLEPRFLPVLYNRRHFGVMTCVVALFHAKSVLFWYFNFSPVPIPNALLVANTSYGQILGFPFEIFGVLALIVLMVLAATSHDFWLNFLTPPTWKAIHMTVYFAYALIVVHISLGVLQTLTNPAFAIVMFASVTSVAALHGLALRKEQKREQEYAPSIAGETWVVAGLLNDLAESCGMVVNFASGERAAIFRHAGKLSATSNVCAHQNGPLGEGCIVDGLITCPWHGFQYDPANGCAPPPFTEKIETYRLKLQGRQILIDPRPNPAGTYVEPLIFPES